MKVYLDNCLPRTLKRHLVGDVDHAADRRWGHLSNGDLLRRVEREYDVFITVDKAQRSQQEWRKQYQDYEMGFLILRVFGNSLTGFVSARCVRAEVPLVSLTEHGMHRRPA